MDENDRHFTEGPDDLLLEHLGLFKQKTLRGPVLDLACGNGHNGVFLGTMGLEVVLADVSENALAEAGGLAHRNGVPARIWQVDLEQEGFNPLASETYGAILVFRYLHRPLIPCIRKALVAGGLLLYETFTVDQARFGKPKNPDHLLKPGELLDRFKGWRVLHYFEGTKDHPKKAIAQIVCIKPD
ncbi:MAG: methyltransferase domain-containing protein [Deltaproteobacteria bacterium]|nr:methyltransferase domain-containing protein [Deltaproteobacteria bacterium]